MKIHKIYKLLLMFFMLSQIGTQFASERAERGDRFRRQERFRRHLRHRLHNFSKARQFKEQFKKLVLKNVVFARLYIESALADLPDKDALKARLLENQARFGKILIPFYGRSGSNQVINLFKEHKNIAIDLIEAIKAKDATRTRDLETKWYKNAKDISVLLNKLNPRWSVGYLNKLFSGLLKLTQKEITLRADKKWKEDIHNFDRLFDYASNMADELSNGLISQFSRKFENRCRDGYCPL